MEAAKAGAAAAAGLPEKVALRAMGTAQTAARKGALSRIAQQINNGELAAYQPNPAGEFGRLSDDHDLMRQLRSFLSDGDSNPKFVSYQSAHADDSGRSGATPQNDYAMNWANRIYIPIEQPKQAAPALSKKEEENTMKALGLLAIMLAEKNARYKKSDKPNASTIAAAVVELAGELKVDTNGIGVDSLRKKIAGAVKKINELTPQNSK